MRSPALLLAAALLWGPMSARSAQAPLRIVDVIRKGLPPYDTGERIYLLDGGRDRDLRVGARLAVRRPGRPLVLGWLQVTEVAPERAEARLEREGPEYLLKGDLAWREELPALPVLPQADPIPLPVPGGPGPGAVAPPLEGLLYFLAQRDELSPAGQRKLAAWVAAWGTAGRWAVQVPAARGLAPELQHRRAATLRLALEALGVATVELDGTPRAAEGKYDPAWVRHWD